MEGARDRHAGAVLANRQRRAERHEAGARKYREATFVVGAPLLPPHPLDDPCPADSSRGHIAVQARSPHLHHADASGRRPHNNVVGGVGDTSGGHRCRHRDKREQEVGEPGRDVREVFGLLDELANARRARHDADRAPPRLDALDGLREVVLLRLRRLADPRSRGVDTCDNAMRGYRGKLIREEAAGAQVGNPYDIARNVLPDAEVTNALPVHDAPHARSDGTTHVLGEAWLMDEADGEAQRRERANLVVDLLCERGLAREVGHHHDVTRRVDVGAANRIHELGNHERPGCAAIGVGDSREAFPRVPVKGGLPKLAPHPHHVMDVLHRARAVCREVGGGEERDRERYAAHDAMVDRSPVERLNALEKFTVSRDTRGVPTPNLLEQSGGEHEARRGANDATAHAKDTIHANEIDADATRAVCSQHGLNLQGNLLRVSPVIGIVHQEEFTGGARQPHVACSIGTPIALGGMEHNPLILARHGRHDRSGGVRARIVDNEDF